MKIRLNYLSVLIIFVLLSLPKVGITSTEGAPDAGVIVFFLTHESDPEGGFTVIPIPKSKIEPESEKKCKPKISQTIDCGSGGGGWIENFYDILIHANQTPAEGNADFFQGDTRKPLDKYYCSADSLSIGRTGTKIVGDKKIISYKVKVTAGDGGNKPISIEQYCTE